MRQVTPLSLSARDRLTLEAIALSTGGGSARAACQATALLLSADGLATNDIALRVDVSPSTVRSWRHSFEELGISAIGHIEKGRGRKPSISDDLVAEVMRVTLHELPPLGKTRWTTRLLADRLGISKDSVARIWAEHSVTPWQPSHAAPNSTTTAAAVVVDLIGVHFDPPVALAIFSVDRGATAKPAVGSQHRTLEERGAAVARIAAALEQRSDRVDSREAVATPKLRDLLRIAERERDLGVGIHLLVVEAALSGLPELAHWVQSHDSASWYVHRSASVSEWGQEVLQWLTRIAERSGTSANIGGLASLDLALQSPAPGEQTPWAFHWNRDTPSVERVGFLRAVPSPASQEPAHSSPATETTNTPDVAAEKLRTAILYGELAPGEHVRQPQWASRLGVSRSVLREAFKILAGQHLLRHDPQAGYFVARLSLSEMRQLYRLTSIVEEEIFRHIRWPSRRELGVIEAQFDSYQNAFLAGDISAAVDHWRRYLFHLYSLSTEAFIVTEAKRLWEIATPYRMIILATMLLQDPDLSEIQEARENQMRALRTQDLDAFVRSIIHDRLPAFERYATHRAILAFFRRDISQ